MIKSSWTCTCESLWLGAGEPDWTRVGNSKSFQSLFSTSIDVCNIVNAAKINLFKKWYKNLLKYGNFLRQCPLNASHYYLRDWQFGRAWCLLS